MSDLEMILGYKGAQSDGEAVEVASDIVCMPFWTPEFCEVVIRAAEATGAFDSDPSDPVPGHEVSLAVISPRLFEAVEQDIGIRMWPQIKKWWPLVDYYGLRDVFVIKYAMGQQEHLRMHHDVAQVSASIKLNDNYEGGVLEFPRQSFDNSNVPVGSLIAWPSLVTHPHASTPLQSGVKYSLTIWCELPMQLEV